MTSLGRTTQASQAEPAPETPPVDCVEGCWSWQRERCLSAWVTVIEHARLPLRSDWRCCARVGLIIGVLPLVRPTLATFQIGLTYWQDRILDVALVVAILLVAAAIGSATLGLLHASIDGAERLLFATGLGLAILAYLLLGIAVPGLFQSPLICALWVAGCLLAGYILTDVAREYLAAIRMACHLAQRGLDSWSQIGLRPWATLNFVFLGSLVALTFLSALTPTMAYDALVYHLPTPREMLTHGGLVVTQQYQGNYPLTANLLYAMALAFGSEVLATLMHFAAAGLLAWAVFMFAARWASPLAGAISVVAFLSIRSTPALASIPYIDIFWALWEVLAIFALFRWAFPVARAASSETMDRRGLQPSTLLILAGLLFGAALGTKYIALVMFGILGPTVFLWGWWQIRNQIWHRLTGGLRAAALFGVVALLVASPWYVKNWLWLGSPLYPWISLPGNTGQTERPLNDSQGENYGIGTSLEALMSLPLRVYDPLEVSANKFSHLAADMPSLLFLLTPLLIFARRPPPLMWWLIGLFIVRALVWAYTLQDLRYLYPGMALLCVPLGIGLAAFTNRLKGSRLARRGLALACLLALAWPLLLQFVAVYGTGPIRLLTGEQSVYGYLLEQDSSGPAIAYMNDTLPSGSRVLLVNDRRSYRLRHFSRSYEGLAPLLIQRGDEPVWTLLRDWGMTHVALSKAELRYLENRKAPAAQPMRELTNFIARGERGHLRFLYSDVTFVIYEIIQQETSDGGIARSEPLSR